jgi:Photosynthesis system II assembly factor YCF48/Putative zinc-finger
MPELPNIVRERLKVSRPTAPHPDADLLTAFAERALPESERAVVAEHLARCHDCRDVLVLALPASVTVEASRLPLPVRDGWLRAPVLRWGVVAAGFAVLTVTGFLQYQRGRVAQTFIAARHAKTVTLEEKSAQADHGGDFAKPAPGAPTEVAGSPTSAPVSANRVNNGSASGDSASAGSTNERVAGSLPPRKEAAAPSAFPALNSRNLAPAPPFHGRASGSAALGSSVSEPIKQSAKLYRGAAPSPAGGAGTQSELVAANTLDQAPNQPFHDQGKDQKEDQGRAPGVGGRAFMDVTVDKAKAPESTTVELSAAAPPLETGTAAPTSPVIPLALRWTISATGGLLRSFDQGRTWASVDVNASFPGSGQMVMVVPQSQQAAQDTSQLQAQSQAQSQSESKVLSKRKAASAQPIAASAGSIPVFRSISAAGLEVWAGGSAGVLYHSANGGDQWTRVIPSASGILLTGDITGIAFSDPQHGQVTTSTQELWTTFDAGQTWQKR